MCLMNRLNIVGKRNLRILFFGMLGTLTRLPLAALLEAGFDLCGLVLSAEIVPPFQLVGDGRASFSIIPIRNEPTSPNLLPTQQAASPLALAAGTTYQPLPCGIWLRQRQWRHWQLCRQT